MLMHPTTRAVFDKMLSGNSHAVLLSGPEGSGKLHLAKHIAYKKLGLANPSDIDKYPHIYIVEPEKQSIGIDKIRSVQNFLKLKTPGDDLIRRIVIIHDAHLMTGEAQNALLKSLEEPPDDTVFVLTAPVNLQLKDTIYSRVQTVPVLSVTEDSALKYYEDKFPKPSIQRAYLISGGYAGLLHALLNNEGHPMIDKIAEAKRLMALSLFDRLTEVDALSKQKDELPLLLQACKLICQSALHRSAIKSESAARDWHRRLSLVHDCEATLSKSPSTKLLLTHLFVEL